MLDKCNPCQTNSSKVKTFILGSSNNYHKKKNGLMMTFIQGSSTFIMNESHVM